MRLSKYIAGVLALGAIFASCDPNQLEEVRSLPLDEIGAPALKSMPTVMVSQKNYDDKEASVTFSWDAADFGFDASTSYAIYLSSDKVSDVPLATGIAATEYVVDYPTLYNRLVGNLGLAKGETHNVKAYVAATIGNDYGNVKSAPIDIKFDVARISTGINMLYLSGAFNSNHPDSHGLEEDNQGSKTYQGLVNMKNPSVSNNSFKFFEYTYAGTTAGNAYGDSDADGVMAIGDAAISAAPELSYVRADLNTGTYSVTKLDGPVRLCGLGGWWFGGNPELVYNAEKDAWIGVAEWTSGTFRISINDNWGFTFGPKNPNDLTVKDGGDIKIYHNDVAKKFVGGDANFKPEAPGRYEFKLYYEPVDCTWHLSVNLAK